MVFFSVRTTIRLKIEELRSINEIININPERFDSVSHFIRCAVLNFIRQEKKGDNK